jgi:hypothetical protein
MQVLPRLAVLVDKLAGVFFGRRAATLSQRLTLRARSVKFRNRPDGNLEQLP